MRLRRSCLTIPGDDERKLAKAAGLEPDEVILDLEDAVAPARKDEARGLVDRERIAAVAGVEALVFGPGDLAASLGVPELVLGEGAHVEYALARVVVAARAFGRAAVDGPHVALEDAEGLRAAARRSFLLG